MGKNCPSCKKTNKTVANFCFNCGCVIDALYHPINTMLHKRYRIVEHMKKGGMANLYKAEDLKTPNKICVIKEMIEMQVDPEVQRKYATLFETEMRILANLRHFGIPDVRDYFIFSGRYYIVMEYLGGKNLEDLQVETAPGGFPERTVLIWGLELAEILEYIHSQDPPVVHRDIKPSNIVQRKEGRLMLIDFGIARFFSKATTGSSIGTPGFIAPEHYKGNPEPRSDIFSLGVTLYQLVSGIDPAREIPYNLPSLGKKKPELSSFAVETIEKMMALDPDARYSNASELFSRFSSKVDKKAAPVVLPPSVTTESQNGAVIKGSPEKEGAPSQESVQPPATEKAEPPAQAPQQSLSREKPPESRHEEKPAPSLRAPEPLTPPPAEVRKPIIIAELQKKSPRDHFDGALKQPPRGMEITSSRDNAKMLLILEGIVLIGAFVDDEAIFTNEKPINPVFLPSFYMDRNPVTIKMFTQFLRETGYEYSYKETLDHRYENHPVVNVTWYDALAYAQWAGKRLPLEVEWEKAARGPDGRKYPWGNVWERERLNCSLLGNLRTTPVGLFPKGNSPYGCQDMVGTIWEWTLDAFAPYPYKGPSAKLAELISVRGGGWKSSRRECRCTSREKMDPFTASPDLGFRCVISAY
jgi:formylglycine-generating enzyme required for sulfatase activity/tRNA A-37 threonylcarbamoyl transferase component Bud32